MKLPEKFFLVQKCKEFLPSLNKVETEDLLHTAQPVLFLAARQTRKISTFFTKIAKLCELEYQPTVPVKIFEKNSLIQQVGLDVASKYVFFPYYKNSTLVIATADPYPWKEILQHCKQKLTFKKAVFVITPPHIIWSALNHSSYIPAREVAEDTLHTSYPQYSGKEQSYLFVKIIFFGLAIAMSVSVLFSLTTVLIAFLVFVNIMYVTLNPIKLGIALGVFKKSLLKITTKQLKELRSSQFPIYTILVPLKDEVESIPQLLHSLKNLQYPKEKLDVKFAVEVTDEKTLVALERAGISVHETEPHPQYGLYQVVKVPVEELSTKPRSCNYALQFARGDIVVIYDAEDQPEPLQLQRAYALFLESKLNTICVQAKLNYYNPYQNILTRCFTAEYTFWFDILLPALTNWGIPLPLGGTSNHFQTRALKTIGTWDPYNVTEDAEVGWRLSRLGYRTAMIDSYTWEEANSDTWNWVRQRTRWQKGFLLTLLVHIRHPLQLVRDLGWMGAFFSVAIFASTVLLPIINVGLWIYTLIWIVGSLFNIPMVIDVLPNWIHITSVINLIFGNLLYIAMHAVGLLTTKRWQLLWILPILPLYWMLQAVSAYRSLWQITHKPHLWEKTVHGLYLTKPSTN